MVQGDRAETVQMTQNVTECRRMGTAIHIESCVTLSRQNGGSDGEEAWPYDDGSDNVLPVDAEAYVHLIMSDRGRACLIVASNGTVSDGVD